MSTRPAPTPPPCDCALAIKTRGLHHSDFCALVRYQNTASVAVKTAEPPSPPNPYKPLPPQPRGTERIEKRWNPKKESGGR